MAMRMKVVGVLERNADGTLRQDVIAACELGERLLLRRVVDSHSRNTIAVCRETGEQLGELPPGLSSDLAIQLDQGIKLHARLLQITDSIGGIRARVPDLWIGLDEEWELASKNAAAWAETNEGRTQLALESAEEPQPPRIPSARVPPEKRRLETTAEQGVKQQTTFVAIDVETANPDRSSICQIGMVQVENGVVGEPWTTLIDPERYFDAENIAIHGITPSMVRGQPRIPDVAARLRESVGSRIVVSHTPFDRGAVEGAHERYRLTAPEWQWLDSARVCRRTWKQFAYSGYGLARIASHCGIQFRHHDAGEDARAAALILLRAIEESGLDLQAWTIRARQPISPELERISREGDPDGPLDGEVIVFTGALAMIRREAADLAARLGCDVRNTVNSRTTMLVVGQQDLEKLGGYMKSTKQRRAEELIRDGAHLAILSEADFLRLATFEARR